MKASSLSRQPWMGLLILLGCLVLAQAALAQAPAKTDKSIIASPADKSIVPAAEKTGSKPPSGKPTEKPGEKAKSKIEDLDTTMNLSLNGLPIDQLVKFLSDTTGKPVMKHKNVQAQISVNSPVPVTKRRALELICDALLMEGVYYVELDHQIQILPADALKGLQLRTIDVDEDIQIIPDSFALAQRVYRLQNASVAELAEQLKKFIPETVISVDPKANTMVLTDRISRLKYYDRLIKVLDAKGSSSDRIVVTFKLQFADAVRLSILIGKILGSTQVSGVSEGGGGGGDRGSRDSYGGWWGRMYGGGGERSRSSASGASSVSVTAGDVTIVPDAEMNWLIVSCPKKRVDEIRKLVAEFDLKQPPDVQARMLDLRHIDVSSVSEAISELFPDSTTKAEKEKIHVVPTEDGNHLLVYSSAANFKVVEELVKTLDTDQAEKRATKTYKIKHLDVADLAEQLTKLTEESSNLPWWYEMEYGRRKRKPTEPSFVACPRTNSLMVLARPKEMIFYEKMITELDVEVDTNHFEPHVYQIHNTDASEVVNILESLFKDRASTGRRTSDGWWDRWRSDDNKKTKGSIEAIFGDIRFVVDNVTNRIVALASNPKDYEVIGRTIGELDKVDPESTEVLVCELKYADAVDVADRMNNLLSEGAVQQPNRQRARRPATGQPGDQFSDNENSNGNNNNNNNNQTEDDSASPDYNRWWQSGGRERRAGEKERPLNTMIGKVRVVPDIRSNKIMIAAPSIYFNSLKRLIEDLDKQEPQVYITARIVEIVHGDDRRIGLRWTPDSGSIDPAELENAITGLGQLGFVNTSSGINPGSAVFGAPGITATQKRDGSDVILGANVNLTLLLQLLVKNSNSRVTQSPGISMNNNETGSIFFGSRVAFSEGNFTSQIGSVTNPTTYKRVGVKLDITPHINSKNQIVLSTQLENSKINAGQLVNNNVVVSLGQFKTRLAVEDGETMVIGGVMLKDDELIDRHIPILGSIPGLKYFFGKKDRSSTVRELVCFITPRIIKDREDTRAIFRAADDAIKSRDPFAEEDLKRAQAEQKRQAKEDKK